jgi:antitoxin VapB
MPWDEIDQLGDSPFMSDGRQQPEMPPDRPVFDK